MYDFFNVTKNYLCFSKIRNTLASKHEQIGVAGFSLAPRGLKSQSNGIACNFVAAKEPVKPRSLWSRARYAQFILMHSRPIETTTKHRVDLFFSPFSITFSLPSRFHAEKPPCPLFTTPSILLMLSSSSMIFSEKTKHPREESSYTHTHTPSTVKHWNIQRYLFTLEFQWFGANSLLAMFAVVGQVWKSRSNWIFINLNHEKRREGW